MKNKDKEKDKHKNQDKKTVIDLTSYIKPGDIKSDVDGSYTGITADMYYGDDDYEQPVQDADDL